MGGENGGLQQSIDHGLLVPVSIAILSSVSFLDLTDYG
jgi:hypothetical protein